MVKVTSPFWNSVESINIPGGKLSAPGFTPVPSDGPYNGLGPVRVVQLEVILTTIGFMVSPGERD